MIALMGATGQVGGAAARALAARGLAFRALSRTPSGVRIAGAAEVVAANPQDAASLARGFAGCSAVFVMIPPYLTAPDVRAEGQKTVRAICEALLAVRPAHVVALSSGGADLAEGTGPILSMHDLEQTIEATGLPVTRIRSGDFMENWAALIGLAAATGILPMGMQPFDRSYPTVSTEDVGGAVAEALAGPAPANRRTINVLGPGDFCPNDLARAITMETGREVTLAPAARDDLLAGFLEAGVGEDYARGICDIYASLNSGRIGFAPRSGETWRGRMTFADVVRRVLDKAAAAPAA
ncbi:MAG TPA: NAD(P)H-binding protein [Albidovulum sp.]|uniref:NmrA family NAD(P)-binding protein n=1 Tax=Albidovulum sp. TaxID=1872424 RepID=UPI002BFB6406|nr:NAD(P)H-binding protein [Albidovulum sp.]